jgi:SlyX protein
MDKETDERLTAVETKLAYVEDFLNQLQEVSVQNAKVLEALRTENRMLSEKLRDLSDSLEEIPNRRPPHY